MKLSTAKKKGMFRFPIDISEFQNEDKGTVIIEMGEPGIEETQRMGTLKEGKTFKEMPSFIAKHMISHPFMDDNGKTCSDEEVVDFLRESASRFSYFTKEWTSNLPLVKMKGGISKDIVEPNS